MRHCRAALLVFLMLVPFQRGLSQDASRATKVVGGILARSFPGNGSFASVSDAFQAVMLQSSVPGGEVIFEGCGGEIRKAIQVHGTTVGKALKSIEAADPRYRWLIENGVVILLPAQGVPPLLKVRVREFNSKDSSDISSAGTLLFALPVVRDALRKLGLVRNGSGSGLYALTPGVRRQSKPLGLDLHNVTVCHALDAIVGANRKGVWVYRETHCAGLHTFEINFSQ